MIGYSLQADQFMRQSELVEADANDTKWQAVKTKDDIVKSGIVAANGNMELLIILHRLLLFSAAFKYITTLAIMEWRLSCSYADAVKFAKKVLQDINNNIGKTNVGELLKQAERMLVSVKDRDFSDNSHAAHSELANAIECKKKNSHT